MALTLSWLRRRNDDDGELSVIDAIAAVPEFPIYRVNPPRRMDRAELHITGPQRARPYVQAQRKLNGKALRHSRATLPTFRETARVLGWRAILGGAPGRHAAPLRGYVIRQHTDKTMRDICSQYEQIKAELREMQREFERRERMLRRPLRTQ